MKYQFISFIIHELEPKKIGIWLQRKNKKNIDFQQPQDVEFVEKYEELSELVAFDQKLRYFTDQNGPNGGSHENEL